MSLSEALAKVISDDISTVTVQLHHLALLVAFVATLIPFYHGALRHLDHVYIEERGANVRSGALLADFVILFIEGCIFLALARLITNGEAFMVTLLILWLVDIGWAVAAHYVLTPHKRTSSEKKWAQNNVLAVAVLAVLYVSVTLATQNESDGWLVGGIVAICLMRTVADYFRSWEYYYPA